MKRVAGKHARDTFMGSWISDVIEKIKEWLTIPLPVPVPVAKPDPRPNPSRNSH